MLRSRPVKLVLTMLDMTFVFLLPVKLWQATSFKQNPRHARPS
jgi:hypothetical protein